MLTRIVSFILLAAILINGCETPSKPADQDSFAELCQALGKSDGKISKEDLLAVVKDKKKAEIIFDSCETNPQGVLTVDEARRQNWAIQELLRLTPRPRLIPPRGGGK